MKTSKEDVHATIRLRYKKSEESQAVPAATFTTSFRLHAEMASVIFSLSFVAH